MVAGALGANGAHALKRVALDLSTANGPVLSPLQHMEENRAKDKKNRPGSATQGSVQVRINPYLSTVPRVKIKKKMTNFIL